MNTIDYIVRKITRCDIPDVILENTFLGNRRRLRNPGKALEYELREKIITDMLIPDMSRVGGVQLILQLDGIPYEKLSNWERVYRIPTRVTSGRIISQAHLITLNLTSNFTQSLPNQNYQYNRNSVIDNSANRLVKNNSPMPNRMNAEVEILSDNVIKINDWQSFSSKLTLQCLLEYSNELTEIRPAYHPVVAKLGILATKSYIWKNHRITLDKVRVEGGREIGVYAEFVEEYRDAYQQYEEYLDTVVAKSLILNDQGRKQEHIWNSGKHTL